MHCHYFICQRKFFARKNYATLKINASLEINPHHCSKRVGDVDPGGVARVQ